MRPLTVAIAPDSFKGSARADAVSATIAAGWHEMRPADLLLLRPMADGGEGTIDAIAAAVSGALRHGIRVIGPDDRPVDAEWLSLPDGSAVVELAATSGLTLLRGPVPIPLQAHTFDFGQAIAAALDSGANRLLLAIGGSASTDGGLGMLEALGARIVDRAGHAVGRGGGQLAQVARIDRSALRPLPPGGATVLSDVSSPLLGPTGAAQLFAPQKGATPAQVQQLDAGLAHLAEVLGDDPDAPGSGAAGGTGYGLLSWGARLESGATVVSDLVGLPAAIAICDLVITGEGRFDEQSAHGKVVWKVAALARSASVPVALIAGSIRAPTDEYAGAISLTDLAGSSHASMDAPAEWLRSAGRDLARTLGNRLGASG